MELVDLPGFIIDERNVNSIRYADDTQLMVYSEKIQKELLRKVVEESKKKDVNMNCKIEYIVMSKKNRPMCELHIGDVKIKQLSV